MNPKKIIMMGKDFMRFKFRNNNKLPYNKKINIPVCVISIGGAIKKGDLHHPQIKLLMFL